MVAPFTLISTHILCPSLPDKQRMQVGADGSYLYSSAWITGENWNVPMTYMHELGHTMYLHHAMQSGCEYCDFSCAMVGALATVLAWSDGAHACMHACVRQVAGHGTHE